MPYDGPSLANQKSRKLGVFDRKLEGSYLLFLCHLLIDIKGNETITCK